MRSKVKCVLNALHFGEGIRVTKVSVREGPRSVTKVVPKVVPDVEKNP